MLTDRTSTAVAAYRRDTRFRLNANVEQQDEHRGVDMNAELPPAVAGFFRAHNTGQTEDFTSLFAADAVVRDEGHEHRGAAIKGWIEQAIAQYRPQAEVLDAAASGDGLTVTAEVSGTFPGSPVQLRYRFGLKGDRIASLRIEA